MDVLQPKVVIGVAAVIAVLILTSLAQEMNRRMAVQREVMKLEQEASQMKKSLIELENLNQYFRTDDYQDRMAREKLNYSAPGEKVVMVPENVGDSNTAVSDLGEEGSASIPLRWWKLFFVNEESLGR